jgi:hypothetical protein
MVRMGSALCFRIGRNDVTGRVHVQIQVGTAFQDLPNSPSSSSQLWWEIAGEMGKNCKNWHTINAITLD